MIKFSNTDRQKHRRVRPYEAVLRIVTIFLPENDGVAAPVLKEAREERRRELDLSYLLSRSVIDEGVQRNSRSSGEIDP